MFAVKHKEILLTPKVEAFNLEAVNPPVTFLLVIEDVVVNFLQELIFITWRMFFLSVIVTDFLGFY